MDTPPILRADGLKKHFAVTQGMLWTSIVGWVKAVDGIAFSLRQGETLALVCRPSSRTRGPR
jgi:oligopeptide transport system ATP-binding protein